MYVAEIPYRLNDIHASFSRLDVHAYTLNICAFVGKYHFPSISFTYPGYSQAFLFVNRKHAKHAGVASTYLHDGRELIAGGKRRASAWLADWHLFGWTRARPKSG